MTNLKCPHCGHSFSVAHQQANVQCPQCGNGFQVNYQQPNFAYNPTTEPGVFDMGPSGKSRGVAGLLAILIGSLGIHYFYLGKTSAGFLTILLSLVTCGIWPVLMFIQGIIMFTMRQSDFEAKYVYTDKTLPLF
ncbi:MAG: NINE protein [Muribaculaceae bacterium]|nr:NINE protein [Muribaculaceae bacterium]